MRSSVHRIETYHTYRQTCITCSLIKTIKNKALKFHTGIVIYLTGSVPLKGKCMFRFEQ